MPRAFGPATFFLGVPTEMVPVSTEIHPCARILIAAMFVRAKTMQMSRKSRKCK